MDKIHIRCSYKTQVLSILTIGVLALGVLSIGFSLEDASAFHKPQVVKAKVKDATTDEPIKNAQCDFTFGPSGETASDNTNRGGVAKVKDPDPSTDETTVDVTCTDGTNSATVEDHPVKKHGKTVVRVLIGAGTTTTTTTTETTETTTVTSTTETTETTETTTVTSTTETTTTT